jgi:hypothetical protein
MTLVLHLIPPGDSPYDAVATFRDALSPASFLVLSHATDEGREPDRLIETGGACDMASAPLIARTRTEIARFFDEFKLVDPGLVCLPQWRPTEENSPKGGTRWAYCGVGKKP